MVDTSRLPLRVTISSLIVAEIFEVKSLKDRTARLWDLASGDMLLTLRTDAPVHSVVPLARDNVFWLLPAPLRSSSMPLGHSYEISIWFT